jgi:hypothetical protein
VVVANRGYAPVDEGARSMKAKRNKRKLAAVALAAALAVTPLVTGCGDFQPKPPQMKQY